MPSRTVETVFRFTNDASATNRVLRDEARIRDGVNDVTKAEKRKAQEASRAEDAMTRSVRETNDAIEAQIRVARANAEVYGDIASRTSAISGLASSLGGTAFGGRLMIAADILDATEASKLFVAEWPKLIEQVKGSLPPINAATLAMGGIATVAAAAVGGGLLLFKKAMEDEEKQRQRIIESIGRQIDAMRQFNSLVLEGGTEATQDELERLTRERDALKKTRDQVEKDVIALFDALYKSGELTDEFLQRYPQVLTGNPLDVLRELKNQVKESDSELEKMNAQIATFEQGIQKLGEATNATSTRIDELTDASRRLEATSTDVASRGRDLRTLAERFGDSFSNMQSLIDEDALNNLISERKATMAELGDVIVAAAQAERDYTAARREANADLQQALQEKETEYQRKRLEAIDDFERDRAEREEDYQRDRAADLTDHLQNLEDIQKDSQERIADLYTEYQKTVADIQKQANKDIASENQEYRRSEKKAQADYLKDREDRERNHRRTLASAAMRLDALAVYEEQQRYKDEQKAAKDAFDQQRQDAADEHRRRLQELRQQLRERLQDEKQNLDERITQERASLQAALEQERASFRERQRQADEAYRLQEERNRQHFQQQLTEMAESHRREMVELRHQGSVKLNDLRTQQERERGEYARHHSAILRQIRNLKDKADAILNGTATDTTVPAYAQGGYTPNGLIRTHDNEFVLTPQSTGMLERGMGTLTQQKIQQMAQNVSNSFQGGNLYVSQPGMSAGELKAVFDRWFNQRMERLS